MAGQRPIDANLPRTKDEESSQAPVHPHHDLTVNRIMLGIMPLNRGSARAICRFNLTKTEPSKPALSGPDDGQATGRRLISSRPSKPKVKPMTEAEWNVCSNSYPMLRPCRKTIRYHPRKGRLFAVACCYRIWHLLTDQRSRAAVVVAEQYGEGLASQDQLRAAQENARAAHAEAFRRKGKVGASGEWAAEFAAASDAWFAASRASNFAYVAAGDPVLEPGHEKAAQAHLLRCIFGPLPFRSVASDPVWLTSTAKQMAAAIYEERAFDRMPILGDALEESGCDNAEILNHCRQPGEHVRGCWVVDLLLAKE